MLVLFGIVLVTVSIVGSRQNVVIKLYNALCLSNQVLAIPHGRDYSYQGRDFVRYG